MRALAIASLLFPLPKESCGANIFLGAWSIISTILSAPDHAMETNQEGLVTFLSPQGLDIAAKWKDPLAEVWSLYV